MEGKPFNTSIIPQLDGNTSDVESESDDSVIIQPNIQQDKITTAVDLPAIASYNMRSIFPKLGQLKIDLIERDISLGFFCEIFQKSENKNHAEKIEKMLEMEGLQYISTPRPSGWGGTAIIVNQDRFTLEKLKINIPHNLEVVWGLLKTKSEKCKFKKIIACSFYSPPKSKKNQKLVDHLVSTLHMLSARFPDAPIMMGADKNTMDIKPLLSCGLKLKQLVDLPTRQGKILDILITNIPQYYNSPIVVPPVPCDNPDDGVPSDHWVPVCYPHTDRYNPPLRRFRTVTYRPLSDENIRKFGQWITSESFTGINEHLQPTAHAQELQELLMSKLDELCPTQTMRVSIQDKPFINKELKTLNRRKQREYNKNGKSVKYKKLATEFSRKYKAASKSYIRNKVDELKEAEPGKAFSVLKSMGAQPGDCTDETSFTLPIYQEANLTDQECCEKIAQHFASISSEYHPLHPDLLPDRVKARLADGTNPPFISEYECYVKLKAAKKPRSVIPGDLPSRIVKEFKEELASPLHKLLNNIVQSAVWPEQYKIEYVTPIAKTTSPKNEDDLRPISLTASFSKLMEQFIVQWLTDCIGDKMDFRQYGGIKGNSVSHYLIEFINFILHQQELENTAVLACLVDFSKAFNRQDHNILITKLSDLGVPGWLLKLVIAFLKNRKMRVKYKGKYSSLFSLPGGGPQGTLLGLFLFLVLIDDAGFSDQQNNAGDLITKKKISEMNAIHLKYVDDLSLAESIDMTKLVHDPSNLRQQPDTYRARTGHTLNMEDSKVYQELKNTHKYAKDNHMKLNLDKTKLILFNPCKTKDFSPEMVIEDTRIDLVEQSKLLGVVITSNLSWSANTNHLVERCYRKMWVMRRLKKLGANESDLMDVYTKQVRSVAEYAVPVWNAALTVEEVTKIERIQKTACNIILGEKYNSYTSALNILGLEKLSARREKICTKFAKKALKHKKFTTWFKPTPTVITRIKKPKFYDVVCKTARFEKSPLSYLTKLLNQHYK